MPGPIRRGPSTDDLDGEFGPGETEAYDRAWSPSVMPGVSDYTPLERAEPAPVSDDEDRIEETIVRGDPLLRSIADAPEENLAAATLVLSTGEHMPITGTILIGRSPSILYAYGDEPRLVTLDVGMTDISRNHLEVRLDGDQVLMRDMGSTNGTLLTRAGTPTVRLPSEAPIVGFPGRCLRARRRADRHHRRSLTHPTQQSRCHFPPHNRVEGRNVASRL